MFDSPLAAVGRAIDSVRDAASTAALSDRPAMLAAVLRGVDALMSVAAGLVSCGGIEPVAGRPVEHLLRHDARLTPWDASTLTAAADTLQSMPHLADAFREGTVSWSQVRAIVQALRCVRANDRSAIDAVIGEHAKRLRDGDPDQLVALVEVEAAQCRPDLTVRREDRRIASSFLAIQGRLDGSASLYGEVDAVSAATIVEALDAVADDPVHPAAGITRAQQRADALIHICETTLSGTGEGGGLRPRPRLLATIDVSAGATDGSIRLLWPLTGRTPRLSRVTRDTLTCDATIVPVVFNGREVIGAGDHANRFSDTVRSAIVARDRRCRFCSRAPVSWCDVHHLRPGKGNTAADGCLLCRRCHRTVHRSGWTADWQEEGALKFERRGKHFLSLPP